MSSQRVDLTLARGTALRIRGEPSARSRRQIKLNLARSEPSFLKASSSESVPANYFLSAAVQLRSTVTGGDTVPGRGWSSKNRSPSAVTTY